MSKRMKGKDLIFISQIRRDGSGTDPITNEELHSDILDEEFTIKALSWSMGTYVASGFNSYVVKIRKEPQP